MRGGSEPGERRGGRQKVSKNKSTLQREQKLAESGLLPLDFLLAVMRDPKRPHHERLDAAAKAAPYVHPRLKAVEAKITVEKTCASDWTKEELLAIINEAHPRGNGAAAPTRCDTGTFDST
jgi:hypothetical protein